MKTNKFQAGAGVFKCRSCSRNTRGDWDSAQHRMCGQCFELAGWDNQHNDDGTKPTPKELKHYELLIEQVVSKGGRENIRGAYEYLWPGIAN